MEFTEGVHMVVLVVRVIFLKLSKLGLKRRAALYLGHGLETVQSKDVQSTEKKLNNLEEVNPILAG